MIYASSLGIAAAAVYHFEVKLGRLPRRDRKARNVNAEET